MPMPCQPGAVDPAAMMRALHRADELRAVARRLQRSAVHDVVALVGPDTWLGPTADRAAADVAHAVGCVDDAAAMCLRLAAQLEDTAHRAYGRS